MKLQKEGVSGWSRLNDRGNFYIDGSPLQMNKRWERRRKKREEKWKRRRITKKEEEKKDSVSVALSSLVLLLPLCILSLSKKGEKINALPAKSGGSFDREALVPLCPSSLHSRSIPHSPSFHESRENKSEGVISFLCGWRVLSASFPGSLESWQIFNKPSKSFDIRGGSVRLKHDRLC